MDKHKPGDKPYRLRERHNLGGQVPFRVPGPDDFGGRDSFGVLAAEDYKVKVKSYTVKQGAENVSQYNPKGEPTVWYTLEPLEIDGDPDAELLGTDGQPVSDDKTLLFFFSPYKLGLKPQVSKSRKFFAAAMNVAVETPVEFEDEKALYDALVGKELIVSVGVKNDKNVITDSRPVRRRKQRSETPAPDTNAVAVAAEILGATPLEGEDEF